MMFSRMKDNIFSESYTHDKEQILLYFYRLNSLIFDGNKVKWSYLENHNKSLYNVLKTYYRNIHDSHTVTEILTSIQNNYTEMPTCKVCGKPTHLTRAGGSSKKYFKTFCSNECRFSDEGKSITKDLYKRSCINMYGVDNVLKVDSIQRKRQHTCLQKYNVLYPLLNKEILLKTFDKENFNERVKRLQKGQYNKFGSLFVHTDEYKQKVYNTKKKNNTFNTSNAEHLFEEYLKNNNYSYISLYKSTLYPFNCDFYLTEYNLYIEINGSWTHGKHPFNKDNKDDQDLLNKWLLKAKQSLYYKNAVTTWTQRDVKKLKTALNNNLNYLPIYSCDIEEIIQIFNDYMTKQFDKTNV